MARSISLDAKFLDIPSSESHKIAYSILLKGEEGFTRDGVFWKYIRTSRTKIEGTWKNVLVLQDPSGNLLKLNII
jgi:hypothetical protein